MTTGIVTRSNRVRTVRLTTTGLSSKAPSEGESISVCRHLQTEITQGRLQQVSDLEVVGNDLHRWRLRVKSFDPSTPAGRNLNEDLQELNVRYKQDYILLEIIFPPGDDYPLKPFFLRVVSPRCKLYTGHVTAGGAVCLESLTLSGSSSGWHPDCSVEVILINVIYNFLNCESIKIQTLTGPGGISGPLRLDLNCERCQHPLQEYSEEEAHAAYQRMLSNHSLNGWGGEAVGPINSTSEASSTTDAHCSAESRPQIVGAGLESAHHSVPQPDGAARVTTSPRGDGFFCAKGKQGAVEGQADFGDLMDDMMDKFQLGGGREACGGTMAAFPSAFQFSSKANQPSLNPGPVRDPPLMPMTHGIPVPGNVSPHRSPRGAGQVAASQKASRPTGKLWTKTMSPVAMPDGGSPATTPRIAAFKGGTFSPGAATGFTAPAEGAGDSPGMGMAGMSLQSPTGGLAQGPGRSGASPASPLPTMPGVASPARGSVLSRLEPSASPAMVGGPAFAQSPAGAHGLGAQPMYPPAPANAPVFPNLGGGHMAFSGVGFGTLGVAQPSHEPSRESASGSSDRVDAHVPAFPTANLGQAGIPIPSGPFGAGHQPFTSGLGTAPLAGMHLNMGGAAPGPAFVPADLSHMPFGWAQPPGIPNPNFASPSNAPLPGARTCQCGHVTPLAATHCSICGSANVPGGPHAVASIASPNAMLFSFSSPMATHPQQLVRQNPPRERAVTSPGTASGGSLSTTSTQVPHRVYITGVKQSRPSSWSLLHWRRAAKRLKLNPVEGGDRRGDTKLSMVLEEVMRLEAELAELKRTMPQSDYLKLPKHWNHAAPTNQLTTWPLDKYYLKSGPRQRGTAFVLQQLESQGLTKMDAEAALRKCNGDGDEALVYGVSCLPDGAAEVEEREFSCPQKSVTECDWGNWCDFLGKMEAKFTGIQRRIFDDFMKIMEECQKQGGLLRDRESEGFEEVVEDVRSLFVDHPDVFEAFEEFLPKSRDQMLQDLQWSDEVERVLQCFELPGQGIPRHRVRAVERIQNPKLWKRYAHKREEIAEECAGNPNEMWLFHGAHEDVLDTIAEEGFDFRVSRSGSLLGHGCYFSVSSLYSDGYARLPPHQEEDSQEHAASAAPPPPTTDEKSAAAQEVPQTEGLDMLLCRVVVGRPFLPTVAHQYLRRPPPNYHCTAATVNGAKVYCIYDNAQAYPEYWIRYDPEDRIP